MVSSLHITNIRETAMKFLRSSLRDQPTAGSTFGYRTFPYCFMYRS